MTKHLRALLLVGLAAIVVGMPATARACALFDWLCGRSQGASVAQTTYAPPYYGPTAVSSVPSVGCGTPVSLCSAPAVACPSQTCYYVQETQYRPPTRPILTALFGPKVEQRYDPCTGCTITTYSPRTGSLFGRTVPTTTYRMVCSPTYAPAVSYSPVVMGASYVSSEVVSSVPSASCCTPALPPAQTYVAPEPAPYTAPGPASSEGLTPRTFAPADEQPSLRPEPVQEEALKPIPDANTKLNSMPAPLLIEPNNRTTSRPLQNARPAAEVAVRHAVYRTEPAAPRPPKLVEVQWQPASR
ncbi:MAG: hypothetical protein RBS80_03535 [Thermoguttaceae bacterium]|jgi:hypothetical protein|nr:hypothetical protein [Thermoguttaceae bacterium]